MKESTSKKIKILIIIVTFSIAFSIIIYKANSQLSENTDGTAEGSAKSYFDGKVIHWIIPNHPGGGYDKYARIMAPYLEKYTGAKVQVRNMPGAGGIRGLTEISRSPANGLTIGFINGGALLMNSLSSNVEGEDEMMNMTFLGRVVTDVRVLVFSSSSSISSFTDLLESENTIKFGAVGHGGSTHVDAIIIRELFALNAKVIHGFDGSSGTRHAMLRGSIDGGWTSYGSVMDLINSGHVRPVLQGGLIRSELLPNVPTIYEFIEKMVNLQQSRSLLEAWINIINIGRVVVAPKGIDPGRIRFLKNALAQLLHDPGLLQDIANTGRDITYASGEELDELHEITKQMPADIRQVFLRASKSEAWSP